MSEDEDDRWRCPECQNLYDTARLEQQLVEAVERHSTRYTLQVKDPPLSGLGASWRLRLSTLLPTGRALRQVPARRAAAHVRHLQLRQQVGIPFASEAFMRLLCRDRFGALCCVRLVCDESPESFEKELRTLRQV
jgi:hypothetical protein